jgi:hypothetical protein
VRSGVRGERGDLVFCFDFVIFFNVWVIEVNVKNHV